MTTVINVRGRKRAELEADPDFIYVGRRVPRAGWPDSPWGNPFKVGMDSIEAVRLFDHWGQSGIVDRQVICVIDEATLDAEAAVEFCRQWVVSCPALRARLPELRGKILGCWCCDWDGTGEPSRPCHAVILARLADEGLIR
jgi:hypothetical protein